MSSKKSYKFIIIGNNNTALSTANLLAKNNKVALIYSHESSFKSSNEYSGEFEYFPKKPDWTKKIDWINSHFNLNLQGTVLENSPKTVESGQLTEFLGFGEREGKTIGELSWYNEQERLELNKNKFQIHSHLLETFEGDLIENTEVTDFIINENEVDHIILNGQKKYNAEQYIFCNPPNEILSLIDIANIPPKFRQKVTKLKAFSTLQVLYRHKSEFNFNNNIHFLMGNKSDFEPCIGYFWNNESQQIFSQWLSLIPSDQCEDIESVGSQLKNLKRQIKRAYPDFYENTEFEKVFVLDQTHGNLDLNLKSEGQIKGINNLYLGSPLFSKESDLYATVEMTEKILNHFSEVQI